MSMVGCFGLNTCHLPRLYAFAWLLKGTMHAFKSEGEQAVARTERAGADGCKDFPPMPERNVATEATTLARSVSSARHGRRTDIVRPFRHVRKVLLLNWSIHLTNAVFDRGRRRRLAHLPGDAARTRRQGVHRLRRSSLVAITIASAKDQTSPNYPPERHR